MDTLDAGLYAAKRAAVFNGGEHLWIEGLLGSNASRQENIDDGLRASF